VAALRWEARVAVISAGSELDFGGAGQRQAGCRLWWRCEAQRSRSGRCSSSGRDQIKMVVFSIEDADRVAFNGVAGWCRLRSMSTKLELCQAKAGGETGQSFYHLSSPCCTSRHGEELEILCVFLLTYILFIYSWHSVRIGIVLLFYPKSNIKRPSTYVISEQDLPCIPLIPPHCLLHLLDLLRCSNTANKMIHLNHSISSSTTPCLFHIINCASAE
jgi:hypothetical protein